MLGDNRNRQPRMRMGMGAGDGTELKTNPTTKLPGGSNIMSGLDELADLS
jgi:hypothetical protein